ncbi:MAG: tryptophan-rich sensory protein [Clostridia bacterium]|nr:tryptophan-rich sensory protein [Clostridia bacterium]
MKKINWKLLLFSLIVPLVVGGLSTLIIKDNLDIYSSINLPDFAPPSFLFGIVWTVLYVLMGVSFYLILNKSTKKNEAVYYFILQLFVNFLWPIVFFNFRLFWLAFALIVLLLYLIIMMIISFYKISKPSAILQIPYLIWTAFATVLNLAIAILN